MKKNNNAHRLIRPLLFMLMTLLALTLGAVTASAEVSPLAWKKVNGVCYNGSGVPINGAITRGIDISAWDETVNWNQVAQSDIDFAFIRIAHGINYIDSYAPYNMSSAIAAGIPIGTYVYSGAKTPAAALKEAQLCINKMKGYKISYPVVYDLEDASQQGMSKYAINQIARAFLNEIKAAGYTPMIYCNLYWYANLIDDSLKRDYDFWIARWGDDINAPSLSPYKYTVWQASSGEEGLNPTKGLVAGINSSINIDIDFGFVDYTKIITPRTGPVAGYVPATSPNTGTYRNGWLTVDGHKRYYVDNVAVTGWKKIDGYYYYFNKSNGNLYTDTLLGSAASLRYVDKAGRLLLNDWVTVSEKTYYVNAKGYALTGLNKINGEYYYFSKSNCALYKNVKIGSASNFYYAGSTGAFLKNRFIKCLESGTYYYYYTGSNYKAVKGWQIINGSRYYFSKTNCRMIRNHKISAGSGQYYYAGNNGRCVKDTFMTITENGRSNTYYFAGNGKSVKGWQKIGDYRYFFSNTTGVMVKNITITASNGKKYTFDSAGRLTKVA